MSSIAENVKSIKQRVAEAAVRSGRAPEDVRLCAATKMNDASRVREAIAAGVDICGENRVQELSEKFEQGAYEGCPLHFIGHLQKNKVKYLVGKVQLIESVDCLELLETIDKRAKSMGLVQDVLLEVNIGGEVAKSGFAPGELAGCLPQMGQFSSIRVRGLMAIPPICEKTDFFCFAVDNSQELYHHDQMGGRKRVCRTDGQAQIIRFAGRLRFSSAR